MSDIRIINVTNLSGIWADFFLKPDGSLDDGEELANIVKVALLTHGLAAPDDILPDPDSTNRRGWWGDLEAGDLWDGWPIGSKLWLLKRAKITPAEAREGSTLVRAEQYCFVALQPLIEKRICTAFEVVATRGGLNQIDVRIKIFRGPLPAIELRFQNLWDEIQK